MEIENGVELPVEKKVRKPRARRAKKGLNPAAGLISALKFILPAQKKAGTVQQQYCFIGNGWLVASNDTLTIATPIQEDLCACPHTHLLLEALSNCTTELQITQLSEFVLSVKSDPFRAEIPCVAANQLVLSGPDEPFASCGQSLKTALESVYHLATDGASEAFLAGVLLNEVTAVSTNGSTIIEYWHGQYSSLLSYLIPKVAISALSKSNKGLIGCGLTDTSITFHFEDSSFIKSQLFNDRFPSYLHLFENESINPWPVPDDFFKALKSIEPFTTDGIVHFVEGGLAASESGETFYKIEGLPSGWSFLIKHLLSVEHVMKTVHFDNDLNKIIFFGNNARGIVSAMERQEERRI